MATEQGDTATPPHVLHVIHGRESIAVALATPLSAASWLGDAKREIAALTGVQPPHQKLIWRGKELKDAATQAPPPSGSKIMLLRNQSYHSSAAAPTASGAGRHSGGNGNGNANTEPTTPPTTPNVGPDTSAPSRVVLSLDASDDDDLVFVQATRGKATYELLASADATLLAVKTRLAIAMGLAHPSALRLIVKGRTPTDLTVLKELRRGHHDGHAVVKCMVLLDASQHDLVEREDELRALQNEAAQRSLAVAQLERRLSRNALPREDALVQLHHLHGDVARLVANVSLLGEQLRSSKLVKLGEKTASASDCAETGTTRTLRVVDHVQQECKELEQRMERLMQSFGGHH
ncbi:hypothetical protein ATCC90586_009178 [Pythium insidiosum]|nr:hypothetical protein ATCC90586_009178 [Pythium insidiosum]